MAGELNQVFKITFKMNTELWGLLILISCLWNPATPSYFVKRFLNRSENDIYSSPDNSTCHKHGCVESLGQKVCQSCCDCRCQNGVYLSRKEICVDDKNLEKSCTVLLGNRSSPSINKVSPQMMKTGQDISFCNVPLVGCSAQAEHCEIIRAKTVYDNYKWKQLWPTKSDMDFEIKQNPTSGNFVLSWNQRECSMNKYNGLLIRLRISCVFDNDEPPMLLCMHLIFPGTFTFGTNPLERTNCTGASTKSNITIGHGASVTAATTKAAAIASVETGTAPSIVSGTHPRGDGESSHSCSALLSAGWYTAGSFLIVLLLVAIVFMWKRRKAPPRKHPQTESRRFDNRTLSQHHSFQSLRMLPVQANPGPSDSPYIVAQNSAVAAFCSRVEEEYYDQPAMQTFTPVDTLYAAPNKDKRPTLMQTGKKRSINQSVSLPAHKQTTNNNATFEVTNGDDVSMEDMYLKVLSLPEGKDWMDEAYDDGAYVMHNDASTGPWNQSLSDSYRNCEPIYMDC